MRIETRKRSDRSKKNGSRRRVWSYIAGFLKYGLLLNPGNGQCFILALIYLWKNAGYNVRILHPGFGLMEGSQPYNAHN